MTGSELLVRLMREHPDLTTTQAQTLLDAFFESIGRHLADGGRVEIRGFGTFTTRTCPTRPARNPQTGQEIMLGMHRILRFRPGQDISRRINDAATRSVVPDSTKQAGHVAVSDETARGPGLPDV